MQMIYRPDLHGGRMTIVCFVSGSGTNYEKIVQRDPNHDYVVFTNRPGCAGVDRARANNHVTIELSHLPYLKAAREKYGSLGIPRNCPERVKFEQDAWRLIEDKAEKAPDLICLAGYDQWLTHWTVDRYYPKILNIHPGDTTKGYSGLHWIPTAKAILAGDKEIRTTLFIVDEGEDTGPVLAQSKPLEIIPTLRTLEAEGTKALLDGFDRVMGFTKKHAIASYDDFEKSAEAEQKAALKKVCESLQNALKEAGDWEVYPFAVHDLVARGRVKVLDRAVYVDGSQMPDYGYRMDQAHHRNDETETASR
jgi:phosphoribosylglycinamide formyltransferase 1